MIKTVLGTIRKFNLIENNDKIVLGVSGGPDSISMLDILKKIKKDNSNKLEFNIVVAHINHMIRKEAKKDEFYVKKYCEKKRYWILLKKYRCKKTC